MNEDKGDLSENSRGGAISHLKYYIGKKEIEKGKDPKRVHYAVWAGDAKRVTKSPRFSVNVIAPNLPVSIGLPE